MKYLVFIALCFCSTQLISQRIDFENDKPISSNLFIKLYGNVDYNQKIESGVRHNGKLDVHRIVTLFGYQFSKKTQFVTEVEYEHASEVFIEQAFAKHQLASNHFLKAGLLLIPMGYINENHEPTAFYSVERPLIDRLVVPSTWREIGIGMTGIFVEQSLRYKLFLVNGLKSYDESKGGLLSDSNALRSARQKGIESTISGLPNLSGQIEYFGWLNTKIGFSFYHGTTNSDLYDGLLVNDAGGLETADSSVVTMTMLGLHTQYRSGNMGFNTQFIYNRSSNVDQYNSYTGNDFGESIYGFYVEPFYAIITEGSLDHLSVFGRYSNYNLNVGADANNNMTSVYTLGLNWKPTAGMVFKSDIQHFDEFASDYYQFNFNVGVWF